MHPEEGRKSDPSYGMPPLRGQAEIAGALGRPESGLSVSKGGSIRRKGTGSLAGSVVIGQGETILSLKRVDLDSI